MRIHLTVEGSTIRRSVTVGVLLWLGCNLAMLAIGASALVYLASR